MRLHIQLAPFEETVQSVPEHCPHCQSRHVGHWQTVDKAVRDTRGSHVTAERYYCRACGRTWRVYPRGITRAATSQRLRSVGVMLYLLGLSYRAVEAAMTALGHPLTHVSVYHAVQAAAAQVPGLRRGQVFGGLRTPALAADVTTVKVQGRWLPLGVTVDGLSGQVLTLDILDNQEAATLAAWLEPIAQQVGAQLLISDDADGFKSVATRLGVPQQVCKAHVLRNTQALVTTLSAAVATDGDGSLAAVGVTPGQAHANLQRLATCVHERQPAQATEVRKLYGRYRHATAPRAGETASVAYRLRALFLDRWNLWPRLTRYRTWRGPSGEKLDGTNNGCERAIGWWIKERYRTMRSYKRDRSAVGVSRLMIWCGNQLTTGADLGLVVG